MTTLDDYTACLRHLHASAARLSRRFYARDAWELVSQLSIAMPFLQDPPGPREICEGLYAAAVDLANVIGTALTRPTEENRADAVQESDRFIALLDSIGAALGLAPPAPEVPPGATPAGA
jgi:hypothetical protein